VTVPVAQIRTGDFRGAVANGIFESVDHSGESAGGAAIRDRFPDDIHSAGRFDPIGAGLGTCRPAPQRAGLANNSCPTP